MRFNKRLTHAINFVSLLTDQPQTLATLAPKVGTTKAHLEQIAKRLKDANLVMPQRGPGGGYSKTKPVSLSSIVSAVGQKRLIGDQINHQLASDQVYSQIQAVLDNLSI